MPGGRLDGSLHDTRSGIGAANAGDYVYPNDVRFNVQTYLLFVMASGWREVEYDP